MKTCSLRGRACGYAAAQGAVPYAPHLLFTQFLDDNDPEQADAGIRMGLQMLRRCDELWLCGTSSAMEWQKKKIGAQAWRPRAHGQFPGDPLHGAHSDEGMEMSMG